MEVAVEVETFVYEVDASPLSHVHGQCVVADQGVGASVEGDESRLLTEEGIAIERRITIGAWLAHVPLALHNRPFVVDLWERSLGVNDEHAVHSAGNVQGDVAEGAVIHESAGIQQPHLDGRRLTGVDRQVGGPTTLTGDRMKVDVVRVVVALEVGKGDVDDVADPTPEHRPRRTAHHLGVTGDAETPHLRRDSVGRVERADPFYRFDVNVEDPLIGSGDGWRHVRRVGNVLLAVGRGLELGDGCELRADAPVHGPSDDASAITGGYTLLGDDFSHVGRRDGVALNNQRRRQERDHPEE